MANEFRKELRRNTLMVLTVLISCAVALSFVPTSDGNEQPSADVAIQQGMPRYAHSDYTPQQRSSAGGSNLAAPTVSHGRVSHSLFSHQAGSSWLGGSSTSASSMSLTTQSGGVLNSYGGGSSAVGNNGSGCATASYSATPSIGGGLTSVPSLAFRSRQQAFAQTDEPTMADEQLASGPRRVIGDDDDDDKPGGWDDPYETPVGSVPWGLLLALLTGYVVRRMANGYGNGDLKNEN